MSKIPQGEWNAIAARYAQGESISKIAQSYGCTPPAIHYILKRNRQRTAARLAQPLNGRHQAPSIPNREPAQVPAAAAPRSQEAGGEELRPARLALSEPPAAPGPVPELRSSRDRESEPGQPGLVQQAPGNARNMGSGSAFTAGLDRELHGRAEAAIEAFRSSFDAALVEGSPTVHQQLRQAASDLMRVAARTTIVLDRLNVSSEHGSARTQKNWRSAYPSQFG